MIESRVLMLLAAATAGIWADYRPNRFVLDLNMEPEHRWDHIIQQNMATTDFLRANGDSLVPKSLRSPDFMNQMTKVLQGFPDEYRREIEGIAREANLSLGLVTMLNVFYELTAHSNPENPLSLEGCSSLLAKDRHGRVLHGRIVDYYEEMQGFLETATIIVDFVKDGKILFTSPTFVTTVGLLTGLKEAAFSVSMNQRNVGTLEDNLIMAERTGYKNIDGFIIRKVLEEETSFEAAVEKLSTELFIAPAYVVVAGTGINDGVLITRDRAAAADVQYLGQGNNTWYLVQTNSDHWEFDETYRRQAAIEWLECTVPSQFSVESMQELLAVYPIQSNLTVFTMVMSPDHASLVYETTMVVTKTYPPAAAA